MGVFDVEMPESIPRILSSLVYTIIAPLILHAPYDEIQLVQNLKSDDYGGW